MSDYNKTTWVNGTAPAINATNLNRMELGIEDAHIEIRELVNGDVKTGHAVIADSLSDGAVVPGTAPVASVVMSATVDIPTGWLDCIGQAVSRSTYLALYNAIGTTFGEGDGVTTFNIPDMRGNFARGWDNKRGQDPEVDREFGTYQEDELKTHAHRQVGADGTSGTEGHGSFLPNLYVSPSRDDYYNTRETGGAETRPKNIALKYLIKV